MILMDLLGAQIFYLRYEWKNKFYIVSERIWKFQIGHWFEMNSWLKSCLCFGHVWMKQVGVAKR